MKLYLKMKLIPAVLIFILSYYPVSSLCDDSRPQKMATIEHLNSQDCDRLASSGVITPDNPIPCDRLSRVRFSYMTDGGVIKDDGELIVLDTVASQVAAITDELLKRGFYIAKAKAIEAYGGDDNASMADNNTSSFNGRPVTGGKKWSMHAYGAAIDINPLQNPFIDISEDGTARISPVASALNAVNRSENRPGKPARIGMAESVVELFAEHGFFVWGGDWNYPLDYQHFQIAPRPFIEKLVSVDIEKGEHMINEQISKYMECLNESKRAGKADNDARALCAGRVTDTMQ